MSKSDWRETPAGREKYKAAREDAQKRADEMNMDVGIEANHHFGGSYRVFLLPLPQHRQGHELRCEVVTPTVRR